MTTPFRAESKVILLVLAALVLVEAGLRSARSHLSSDIEHIDAIPAIAAGLQAREGLRVLVGGNSLIGEGVDPVALERDLSEALGRPVAVGVVKPDGTTPLEWEYLYRKHVFQSGHAPDALVLGFGPGHLRDRRAEAAVLRLALHHVDRADTGRLFRNDLAGFEERATFVLASGWWTFGLRDRIAPRILAEAIPNYRALAPILLQAPEASVQEPGSANGSGEEAEAGPTFEHLNRLLASAEEVGVPVILVEMPAPRDYDIEPEAREIARAAGAPIVDVNPVPGIVPASMPDGEHLDAEGRARFTAALARALAAELGG